MGINNDLAANGRWFRMPGHGRRDAEFQISRALFYEWRRKGLIRTRTVLAPGAVRGVTFIDRLSVLALIENAEANDHKPMN